MRRQRVTRSHGVQEASVEREIERTARGDDRMMHGDELAAVWKRAFDLHLVDQLRHSFGDVFRAEELPAEIHQLRDGATVADELEQLRGDERDRLGMVQPDAAREPLLREDASLVKEELVDFFGVRCMVASYKTTRIFHLTAAPQMH